MKHLVQHLIDNYLEEIVSKSFLNCHAIGLHSIMLSENKEKTIRLFITDETHTLHHNTTINDKMTLGFHPHNTNLSLHCIKGRFTNWIIRGQRGHDSINGIPINKYRYKSQITEDNIQFDFLEKVNVKTASRKVVSEGQMISMMADEIHTVSCEKNTINAWLVYEGRRDDSYQPLCYSNNDLIKLDTSELYKKPTKEEIFYLLDLVGLLCW